ncbi:MAG: hemolysin family protein [Chloroflexota bacterium]
MLDTLAIVAAIALLVFVTAFYVAGEFATVSSRKTRVSQMAAAGDRLAGRLAPVLEDRRKLDSYVAACQLGISASSLVLGAYGQSVIAPHLVRPLAALITFVRPLLGQAVEPDGVTQAVAASIAATGILILLTILSVVLGELLPKSIAVQYPEDVARAVVVPMQWSLWLFRPFIWFFNGSGNLILRLLGQKDAPGQSHVHSPEEIELLVTESHQGGLLDDTERRMLRNAFRMRDLTARQVMVHRTRLVAAPVASSVRELMKLSVEEGFTRIPLYKDTIDNIIGFVHVKDLFRLHVLGRENLAEILREVVHVPESLPISEVWETLNNNRQYMAIVFDEFGGTAGLITFEDLIEEIFGELQDEFDEGEMAIIALDKQGRIYLRGDVLVTDANEYLDLKLPEGEADTLGGLVLSELGRPPVVGDEVTVGDTAIRVEVMDDFTVTELSLQTTPTGAVSHIGEWEVMQHE